MMDSTSKEHLGSLADYVANISPGLSQFYKFEMVDIRNTDINITATTSAKLSTCAFCKFSFLQESPHVTLVPRPKLTKKILKLLHRHGNQRAPLGKFHQKLVSDFLNGRNRLMIKCPSCKMTKKMDAQSYQQRQEQKLKIKQLARPPSPPTVPLTKQQKKKERQKIKKKKKKLANLVPDKSSETVLSRLKNRQKGVSQAADIVHDNVLSGAGVKERETTEPVGAGITEGEVKTTSMSVSRSQTVAASCSNTLSKTATNPSRMLRSHDQSRDLQQSNQTRRKPSDMSLNHSRTRGTIPVQLLIKENKTQEKVKKKDKWKMKSQTLANILKQEKNRKEKDGNSLMDFLSSVS